MKNFLKGIIGGIGNIVPGLSGSALLVILGVYENCINAISNIFKETKKSIKYLIPIGLGILLGTFIFSNIIEYFLHKFPLGISIVFVGLLIGTLPTLFKEATKKGFKWQYLISFLIAFTIGIILLFFKENNIVFNIEYNMMGILKLISIGLVLACATIIPGISATVLLSMIGMYGIYLNAINTLNIKILIPIVFGLAVGAFILSKILNYLLKKQYGYTFFAIVGFTIATIPALFTQKLVLNLESGISIIISILSGFLAFYILKKANK